MCLSSNRCSFFFTLGYLNTCKYDAIPCTNQCAAMILRLLMEDHLFYTCSKRRTRCKFCNREYSEGFKFSLELHMESSTNLHHDLMSGLVLKQQHQITSLRNAFQNFTLNTSGILLWRACDYTQKMSEAKSKKSYEISNSPFYTSQYGYKLMASLFLNSNRAREGTHLSVYIKILPREYDSILS
ncbi:TNF receptor-associated factor 4-like isoform X2 [Tachypleus tridentatus]|uniref:TNF receptor-associated factor 4-like isoform X2 n=1 Tax=Tachypleus tridentatus TaxID=6853 RepID=UPI003FD6BF3B